MAERLTDQARLSTLAALPPDAEEPHVERAWARIDGSVRFLVRFGTHKIIVTKDVRYGRLGGAPRYSAWYSSWSSHEEFSKISALAEVAASRFERTHQLEEHNLYNNWDLVQAQRRELSREQDEESPQRRRVLEDRRKLSELLKLARAAPEKMPKVVSIRSFEREKKFLLRFG